LKKKLNKKEMAEYKKLLLNRKGDVMDAIDHASEETIKKSQKDASGDISGYTYHMADVATDTYDREFSLGVVSSERKILIEVADALKKLEEGVYGICEGCKLPIAKTRLKAIPYARLCVKCQEKKEKR